MTFSIEEASDKIYAPKTREYFREVLASYAAGSYRSAIVMLYTVAICDIIYKLRELNELYDDATARDILDQVKKKQTEKPTSPEWETLLIEQVRDRTRLLEAGDYQNILNLQSHRHLSAHPILEEDFELYSPNKDTARAHVRNVLEGLLLRPPILAQKITETFVEDLARIKDIITDVAGLSRYLESKYFRNMVPEVQNKIFRSLWKFVFRLIDAPTDENRQINYQALEILLNRNKERMIELIKSESVYYSNISSGDPTKLLISLLASDGRLYALFEESAKEIISQQANKDGESRMIAWYIEGNMEAHLNKLKIDVEAGICCLDNNTAPRLRELALEHGCDKVALDLFILDFGGSGSYDAADYSFSWLIEPYLQEFSQEQFVELIDTIDKHSQLHGRARARGDNTKIKAAADDLFARLGSDFNYAEYQRFEFET